MGLCSVNQNSCSIAFGWSEVKLVFLALTKNCMPELLPLIRSAKMPIWVDKGVASESELRGLRDEGIEMTAFNRQIDPQNEISLVSAIDTVQQHHPNQTVWVEGW